MFPEDYVYFLTDSNRLALIIAITCDGLKKLALDANDCNFLLLP